MLLSSIWSLQNELNAFRMSILKIMSCGRALLINFRVVWTTASATPAKAKQACTWRSCFETLVRTDCTASFLAILLNTLPTAIGRMPMHFLRMAVKEEASCASRYQCERLSFMMWLAGGNRVEKSASGFACIHAYEISDAASKKSVFSSDATSCEGFDVSLNWLERRT